MSRNRRTHKYSLFGQFCPDNYKLELSIDNRRNRFSGSLQITGFRRSAPSSRITLNQSGLKVKKAKIFIILKGEETEVEVARVVHLKSRDEVRLHTNERMMSGKFRIELDYVGEVNLTGSVGLYKSAVELGGKTSILATQMETHYARMLLPCIDEPEAKAVFELKVNLLGFSDNDEVLFNTSLVKQEDDIKLPDLKRFIFEPTPKMSSYLLALAVGSFLKVDADVELASGKVKVSVICASGGGRSEDQLSFALNFAVKALPLLEGVFDIPYTLNKLDLMAVPDFNDGGMENWGLIMFKEELLLFDEDQATLMDKQSIAQTIAHEIAHQWFGNLVTMRWWDELWLNEGFAAFMEYWVIDKLYPEWSATEAYMMLDKPYGMRMDAVRESRPAMRKVERAQLAEQTFDGIAYEKAAGIIRMVFDLIGEDKFFKGLGTYFEKHKFGSVNYNDLIACWNKGLDFVLVDFMNSWILKPGFPVIDIEYFNNESGSGVVLRQNRFLIEGENNLAEGDAKKLTIAKIRYGKNSAKQIGYFENYLKNRSKKEIAAPSTWDIPIRFKNEHGQESAILMKKAKHTIFANEKNGGNPVFLNSGGTGMYLVNYDKDSLKLARAAMKRGNLSFADRINFLNDIIMLVKAFEFSPGIDKALKTINDILEMSRDAENPSVAQRGESYLWGLAGGFFGFLHGHLIQLEGVKNKLNDTVNSVVAKRIEELGFEFKNDETPDTTETRFELLSIAALLKLSPYSEMLNDIFDSAALLSDNDKEKTVFDFIPPEKRILVLYSIARRSRKSDYDLLRTLYLNEKDDAALGDDIQYCLANFRGQKIEERNIELLTDTRLLRPQDVASFFASLCGGRVNEQKKLDQWFMHEGWVWIRESLDESEAAACLQSWFGRVFTTEKLKIWSDFMDVYFANNVLDRDLLGHTLEGSVNIAKSRIMWQKKGLEGLL